MKMRWTRTWSNSLTLRTYSPHVALRRAGTMSTKGRYQNVRNMESVHTYSVHVRSMYGTFSMYLDCRCSCLRG